MDEWPTSRTVRLAGVLKRTHATTALTQDHMQQHTTHNTTHSTQHATQHNGLWLNDMQFSHTAHHDTPQHDTAHHTTRFQNTLVTVYF